AENGRSEDSYFKPDTDIASDRAEPGRKEQRADRGQHATGDVTEGDGPPDGNAGVVSRAARAADRGDVPAGPQSRQEDVAEDRHRQIQNGDAGDAEHVAAANEVPGWKVGKSRCDP